MFWKCAKLRRCRTVVVRQKTYPATRPRGVCVGNKKHPKSKSISVSKLRHKQLELDHRALGTYCHRMTVGSPWQGGCNAPGCYIRCSVPRINPAVGSWKSDEVCIATREQIVPGGDGVSALRSRPDGPDGLRCKVFVLILLIPRRGVSPGLPQSFPWRPI